MHLVALTRWKVGSALESELSAMAAALGLGLYDARLKLAGPLPNVIGSGLGAEAATALREMVRGRGHGAIACDTASLFGAEQLPCARSVTLAEGELRGVDAQGQGFALALAEVTASLRSSEQSDESQTVAVKGKQLAIGRALLTGGLMRNKSVTKLETSETSERQRVLYVFGRRGNRPLVFKETRLNYEGLGAYRGLTVHDSFEGLVRAVREAQPRALHDDRLLTQKRRVELTAVRGVAADRVISNSNANANALAAQLIVLAREQEQL